jgi:hypothetical protein
LKLLGISGRGLKSALVYETEREFENAEYVTVRVVILLIINK